MISNATIVEIPLEQLHHSPFNRTVREAGLAELAASIKSEGRIHEPLLVRPIVPPLFAGDPNGQAGFEIVFGERRKRAAAIAGLLTAPCMVRTLTDDEARRAQIAENLQREDVHPIEQAESFQALIDAFGYTADRIAEEQGQSRSWVYGRLKLLEACPRVRKACLADEIGSEVALLVARLRTDKLQVKALEYIDKDYRASLSDGGARSFRAIRDMLNEKFTLELKHAIFPIEDATLLPGADDCPSCPKRTGNAPEFADVVEGNARADGVPAYMRNRMAHAGPDVCTDPDCFDSKKKAHLKREQVALEAKGKTVIAGAKARAIVDSGNNVKGGYVEAAAVRDLIKKAKVDVAISTVQNPRDGKTRQVVKLEDLKAAGVKVAEPKEPKNGRHDYEAEGKKREAQAELQTKINKAVLLRVRAAQSLDAPGEYELRTLAAWCIEASGYSDDAPTLAELHDAKGVASLRDTLATATLPQITRIILDCALIENVEAGQWGPVKLPDQLIEAAAHYGIDVDAVKAEILGEAAPVAELKPARRLKKAKGGEAEPVGDDIGTSTSLEAAWPFPKREQTEAA